MARTPRLHRLSNTLQSTIEVGSEVKATGVSPQLPSVTLEDAAPSKGLRGKGNERICFPHVSGPVPPIQGQIRSSQGFAKALRKTASKPEVQRVLEIGTWYGGGSTVQLVEGIKDRSECISNQTHHCCRSFVVTMEVFHPAWKHASLFHQKNPVWLVEGTTVGVSEMLQKKDIPPEEINEHYRLYYERDKKIMAQGKPLLRKLCKTLKFQFVLIDGNEYTGWGEFQIVRDVCKPHYLALHDCKTLKTRKVEKYLEQQNISVVAKGFDNNAAWAIYDLKN